MGRKEPMSIKENIDRSEEVLAAYWRQGMKELGAAFYGPGTVAQSPEYGMIHTKLPSEIAEDMKPDKETAPQRDNSASLDRYTQERPDRGQEQERDDRQQERE